MSWSVMVMVGTLAVLLVGCLVGVIVAIRVVIRALQSRKASTVGLLRAGAPSGTDDPEVAFDRASGTQSWTRIGGGF